MLKIIVDKKQILLTSTYVPAVPLLKEFGKQFIDHRKSCEPMKNLKQKSKLLHKAIMGGH